MDLLVRSTTVIDPESNFHLKTQDILIENGVITQIASSLKNARNVTEFRSENLHVSPGWVDMQANFGEPGHEQKETIQSGIAAAIRGGVTNVLLMPATQPVNDQVATTEFIKRKGMGFPVNIWPAGALSKGMKGEELSEMFDMSQAGVVAFSDYKNGVKNSKLLQLALQYVHSIGTLIIQQPFDAHLVGNSQIHEGLVSVKLGMKGHPVMAEVLGTLRDVKIAEYCGSPLHFAILTTEESIKIVEEARKSGLPISAGISPHYLYFSDEHVQTFDSVHKVFPPYRSEANQSRLVKALKKNMLQVICSDHSPQDEEHKALEFEYAAAGIIGLETLYAASNTALRTHLTQTELIQKISHHPRAILKLPEVKIEKGYAADLTFFNPDYSWEYKKEDIQSKSANSPFIGQKFIGKALAIYNQSQFVSCI